MIKIEASNKPLSCAIGSTLKTMKTWARDKGVDCSDNTLFKAFCDELGENLPNQENALLVCEKYQKMYSI